MFSRPRRIYVTSSSNIRDLIDGTRSHDHIVPVFCRTTQEEGLASGRDFKILAGAVVAGGQQQQLTGLQFLPNSSGRITTRRGQPGYQRWSLQPDRDELQLEARGFWLDSYRDHVILV